MQTHKSRRFRWTPGLLIGLGLLSVVVVVAILAPELLGGQADVMGRRAAPPSPQHWLGTDAAGHDMLFRSLVATRLTLLMTIGATGVAVIIGVILGTGVWLMPPQVREASLRVIDGMVAFPGLLLALVIAAVLGAGAIPAVVAIGAAGMPYFARLTANLAAKVSQQDYVMTARLLGVSNLRVARIHMLPNMAEPLLVLSASTFAQSLTAISALSFVGLGVQSPAYDWGKLLNESLPFLLSGRAYQMVGPAALIVLTGLSAVLIGDGLAAAANPRSAAKTNTSAAGAALTVNTAGSRNDYLVDVRNLVVSAGPRSLVRGISFGVRNGEVLGVVGESGSGKTLTAMSLAQLLPEGLSMTASRMALGDLDLRGKVEPKKLAESVGLVYQDPGTTFNPALRMGTQLTEVLRTHKGQSSSAARERILKSLQAVHLGRPGHLLRQHPHELSGGMRQRAMIASALAAEPRLIIADEPTTALDVTVQVEILRELKRANREYGAAMMFISHDIEVVKAICDRVLVMYQGKIVEEIEAKDLTVQAAKHPYTQALLAATPSITEPVETLTGIRWTPESKIGASNV